MEHTHLWYGEEFGYIDFTPGVQVGEEHRAWQGCPSVAVTKGGRLFAAWYTGGAFEPCIENYNIVVMSDDGGANWSDPILTVGTDKPNRMRKIDAQLWVREDNCLWLMWTQSPYYETSVPAAIKVPWNIDYHREFPNTEVMVCRDPDASVLVWERPRVLCDGFMRNKPISLTGGRIIAPAYAHGSTEYLLRYSDDNGETFYDMAVHGKPDTKIYDEITIAEIAPDHLRFLARTGRGYYVYADSLDGGESWTDAAEYEKAPGTRCYYGRLKNGMIIYVRNVSDDHRNGMKVCLSEDSGKTFPYQMLLDDRTNLSYPDVDEDAWGNIYIVYDRERDNRIRLNRETWVSEAAKEILIARLRVEDIISGVCGDESYLRCVISRGGKHTVDA